MSSTKIIACGFLFNIQIQLIEIGLNFYTNQLFVVNMPKGGVISRGEISSFYISKYRVRSEISSFYFIGLMHIVI